MALVVSEHPIIILLDKNGSTLHEITAVVLIDEDLSSLDTTDKDIQYKFNSLLDRVSILCGKQDKEGRAVGYIYHVLREHFIICELYFMYDDTFKD